MILRIYTVDLRHHHSRLHLTSSSFLSSHDANNVSREAKYFGRYFGQTYLVVAELCRLWLISGGSMRSRSSCLGTDRVGSTSCGGFYCCCSLCLIARRLVYILSAVSFSIFFFTYLKVRLSMVLTLCNSK